MNEVWMLDYINAVFPWQGVFESESAAWAWVQTNDPERKDYYTPFSLTINRDLKAKVPTSAPQQRYVNQR